MNIMEVNGLERLRYYIDCPIDIYPTHTNGADTEVRRVEIPRELAVYIESLKNELNKIKDKA